MSRALPYYKMYPGDAETDENFRLMTLEQRGFYWTALNHAWLNDGLPNTADGVRKIFGLSSSQWGRIWPGVRSCFADDGKRLRNHRQEAERAAAVLKSERATESVRTRYERSTNDTLRASGSESNSGSVSGFSEKVRKKEKLEVYSGQTLDFEEFWREYWRKVGRSGRHGAASTYEKHVLSHELHLEIMTAIRVQKPAMLCREMEARPHASTWLNQHRWEDDPAAYAVSTNGTRETAIQRAIREA